MCDPSSAQNRDDLVCYVFHHWSGHEVDRSEVVVTTASCTPIPREEVDRHGLSAWYLFRSVPRGLCAQAGQCTRCVYALGESSREEWNMDGVPLPPPSDVADYNFSL